MAGELPKYVHARDNGKGKTYYGFRKRGFPWMALPKDPDSLAFKRKYLECLEMVEETNISPQLGKTARGSFNELLLAFKSSVIFASLNKNSTQKTYTRVLEGFAKQHGDKPINRLERKIVERLITQHADRPAAANQLLKRLRQLFDHGVRIGMMKFNPASDIKYIKYKKCPIHTWSEDEVTRYANAHKEGSLAHTAFMLLLYTGVRRSDLVRLGKRNLKHLVVNGNERTFIVIRQQKTAATVEIPVHDDLAPIISRIENEEIFVCTQFGKAFSANGFGSKMRDWCDAAGLSECSAHGLRSLTATRLAEAGCNENTLSAILGWLNNEQAAHYTRAANKRKLALKGIDAI